MILYYNLNYVLNIVALKDILLSPQPQKGHCLGARYFMNYLKGLELLYS